MQFTFGYRTTAASSRSPGAVYLVARPLLLRLP